jgi:hypothetical protein
MTDGFPFLFETLAGSMFLDVFAGNAAMLLFFSMFFFIVFGIALRLTNEMVIFSIFFAMVIISSMLNLGWIISLISLAVGLVIGLVLIKVIFSG